MPLTLNSLVQGISQGIFFLRDPKTSDYAQNTQNRLLRQGTVQGIQGISPEATEGFGVTCCFAAKAGERSGKWQGIPELTVKLRHDETGIAFIQPPQKLPQALQPSEAVPSIVLKTGLQAKRSLRPSNMQP